jgi:hypothetical protein
MSIERQTVMTPKTQTKTQQQLDDEAGEQTPLERERELREEILALEKEQTRLETLIKIYGGDRRKVQS